MGFKRKLFYLGGFDPRGVQYYYALFVEQMARHIAKSGEDVLVSPRTNGSRFRSDWTIENPQQDVTTAYSFLKWEDIVLNGWIRDPLSLLLRSVDAYCRILLHGDFRTGKTLGRGPLTTLFYPLIIATCLPVLVGAPAFLLLYFLMPWWAAAGLAAIGGGACALLTFQLLRGPWLMRFFIFNSDLSAGRHDPKLDLRLDLFADEILGDEEVYDEVLLVAHSNGCILSVPLMARLLERWGGKAPKNFRLVTMGHCIPLVACRRDAHAFRQALDQLAESDFEWVDIGSPPDGAGYYGVNPLTLYRAQATPRVELLSPRFHRFYDPQSYHSGWTQKYEIHFDYLRSGDRVSPLDLQSLTTSARRLEESVAAFKALA